MNLDFKTRHVELHWATRRWFDVDRLQFFPPALRLRVGGWVWVSGEGLARCSDCPTVRQIQPARYEPI